MRFFMSLFALVLMTCSMTPAFAGMEVLDNTTSLKTFSKLKCGAGLKCTKVKDYVEMKTYTDPVTATATTITAAQCGKTFVNAAAMEMELPEASTVLGCRLTFIVGHASTFTIDPDAADQIMLLTDAAGDSLAADAVGESVTIEAISASAWAPVGAEKGTWTDSN